MQFLAQMSLVILAHQASAKTASLTAAQRAFGLHCARQSRAASWKQFSSAIAKAVTGGPAVAVKEFRPSFVLKDDVRDYQVLAVRLHGTGPAVPCLVEAVYRGSGKKHGSMWVTTMVPSNLQKLAVFMVNNLVLDGGPNLYFSMVLGGEMVYHTMDSMGFLHTKLLNLFNRWKPLHFNHPIFGTFTMKMPAW